MNYNYLPVKVAVKKSFCLDGQEHHLGEVAEIWWLHAKHLEREGIVERVITHEHVEGEIRDVMVFVPVYRLEPATVQAVMALAWDGPLTHIFQRDNPSADGKANHLHQYRRGRETFLAGHYDAMLIIESDIVPPADALQKLAALQVDLAYGVYVFRSKHFNTVNIFERYPDSGGQRARNAGESLSVKPWLLAWAIRDGRYPCSGGGFGCLLVRRRVLERIDFRMGSAATAFCDTFFTDDAWKAGFSMEAEMTVLCDHIDVDGTVFHPKLPGLVRGDPARFPLGENGAAWNAG